MANLRCAVPPNYLRFGVVALVLVLLGLWSQASFPGVPDSTVSRIKNSWQSVKGDPLRPLVVYVYAENDTARPNLEFFVNQGLHANADFLFVFNGETNMTQVIPDHPNVRIKQRDNTCYDLGTLGEVLQEDDLWKKYKRFITMNASVRGPFLPVWSQACWTDLFLGRITDKVKLVGTTVNCAPKNHVQSMVWATDDVGMGILLDPKLAYTSTDDEWGTKDDPVGLSGCYNEFKKAVHSEVGSTGLILSQGYEVDVMMTSFSTEKGIREYCRSIERVYDVQYDKHYFGINLHPYETVFYKTNRGIDPTVVDRFTEWQMKRGFSSWELCKR